MKLTKKLTWLLLPACLLASLAGGQVSGTPHSSMDRIANVYRCGEASAKIVIDEVTSISRSAITSARRHLKGE